MPNTLNTGERDRLRTQRGRVPGAGSLAAGMLAGGALIGARLTQSGPGAADLLVPALCAAAALAGIGLCLGVLAAVRGRSMAPRVTGGIGVLLAAGVLAMLAEQYAAGDGERGPGPSAQSRASANNDARQPAGLLPANDMPNLLRLGPDKRFPLQAMTPQPVAKLSVAQVQKMWPAFRHRPYAAAGFNALSLPFRYRDDAGSGDPAEALAFAFLLSSDLDWGAGCYCARHAYFVFKRDRELMQPLARAYDVAPIRALVPAWSATHAIGGEIVRSFGGYGGTLEIYDPAGRKVHTKEFAGGRSFFDLLADMGTDALRFFGHEPSPALEKHLRTPRCRNPHSLVLLGQAAFAEENSDQEFDAYARVLDDDPDFAEVRYHRAVRKHWAEGTRVEYHKELGRSLRSYVTMSALSTFEPETCLDRELVELYPSWVARAEQVCGADAPELAQVRVGRMNARRKVDAGELERALRIAGQWPNQYWLVYLLGESYANYYGGPADADLAASLFLSAIEDRYLVGSGDKSPPMLQFAAQMVMLGHNDLAAQVLEMIAGRDQPGANALLVQTYFNMGQFEQAVQSFKEHEGTFGTADSTAATYAAVAAAMVGRKDVLDGLRANGASRFEIFNLSAVLKAYADALGGGSPDVGVYARIGFGIDPDAILQWGLLIAQTDVLNGTEVFREQFREHLAMTPNVRPAWVLFDAYERVKPSKEARDFYETLEWLHGDDPWVVHAVADWRERCKPTAAEADVGAEASTLIRMLADCPTDRWPEIPPLVRGVPPDRPAAWMVAATVKRLIDARQFEKARELALRFHAATARYGTRHASFFANHLIHKLEQAAGTGTGS